MMIRNPRKPRNLRIPRPAGVFPLALAATAILALAHAPVARAAVLTAVADTYIHSASGSNGTPQQNADPTGVAANDNTSAIRYSFIRFDISAVVDPVAGARLELTHRQGASGTTAYQVFGLIEADDDWAEATLTWLNSTNRTGDNLQLADMFGGAALAEFTDTSGTNTAGDLVVAFDVTSGPVLSFLAADADGLVSFVIAEKIVSGTDAQGDSWVSREGAVTLDLAPPTLILAAAVPAPAALPAALALIGLIAARRPRRR